MRARVHWDDTWIETTVTDPPPPQIRFPIFEGFGVSSNPDIAELLGYGPRFGEGTVDLVAVEHGVAVYA